ncbi:MULTISPECIES: branched-chain amino acid ABC transporter permease [Subtercola]|uniref:Branched-chain amino acid ABC transporter permease n=1 Tax=Subtercola vilae TaxID=2056433 RepID=A0A4T2C508_9MICO|nr:MULTISPECIES: branched-chain amino acid ABC transporter permease [Subtercola]MEA9984507.1 branched-chain amino acid ABC transporter permease [Subtercola sp. RTI3]TIH39425.1 branched-chain amino acid ABC transporter permease [Subtercola vilae]
MDFTFIPLAFGQLLSPQTIGFALAALGLAVHFGFGGLLNFGQAGFMSVGGYFFAITAVKFGFPFWLSLVAAIIGAVIFAFILGIPTLRLRADYLSIVTIAAAEIVRYTVQTPQIAPFTGGSDGINGSSAAFDALNPIPPGRYGIAPLLYSASDLWIIICGWGAVLVLGLLVWQLMRSPWGRVIKGIREDEDAVRSLGKNVYAYKMQALILGGVLGALGAVVAIIPTSLQPENFGTQTTFFLFTIILLGGATTVLGPIIGSIIFWVVLSLSDGILSILVTNHIVPLSTVQQGPIRFIIVGVALMLLVIFRPQGILGKKRETYFSV